MSEARSALGWLGMLLGSAALVLALVHFWAGPFAPQPTLETTIGEKAAAIRKATTRALKGEEPESEPFYAEWNADKVANVATAALGGVAIILGVFGFARRESLRPAIGAAALGVSAISFQFIAMYAMALLVVLLIVGALASLGLDVG